MKILSVLTIVVLLMCSCGGKSNECTGVSGTLKVVNNSAVKFDIYINDVKKMTLNAGATGVWVLNEDYYITRAVQIEGISGDPREYNWNASVTACSTTIKTIPQ
jgi:hypothetical protein